MVLSTLPLDVVILQCNGSHINSVPQENTGTVITPETPVRSNDSNCNNIVVNNNNSTNGFSQVHQINRSSNSSTCENYAKTKGIITETTNANILTESNYLFLQQNNSVQYATNEACISSINQSSNIGNLVLVATEPASQIDQNIPLKIGGFESEEELTSLSWLHDKNLINEIVACTNDGKINSAYGSNNLQKVNVTAMNEICTVSPNNIDNIGQLSPSNELLDESLISEDNVSSASFIESDHNINVRLTDFSKQVQQYIHYNNNIKNNNNLFKTHNNNIINHKKNKSVNIKHDELTTQIYANFVSSSLQANEKTNSKLAAFGATTTVHVGPSGTTTLVEYKTNLNFVPLQNQNSNETINNNSGNNITASNINNSYYTQVPFSSKTCPCINSSVVLKQSAVDNKNKQQNKNNQSSCSIASGISATHHPHKKYLREQRNAFHQICSSDNNGVNSYVKSTNAISESNHSCNADTSLAAATNFSFIDRVISLPVSSCPDSKTDNTMNSPKSNVSNMCGAESSKGFDSSSSSIFGVCACPSEANQPQQIQKSTPTPTKQKHPTNVPYDPLIHTHNKPPYSFSSLIFMAIEGSNEKALPVKEIYSWIVQHFPYFKTAPTGWKNSVRHNLSLNKSFVKVEKAPNMGKGSLWRVEQQQRQNLIQALTRSPFFPNSAVEKISLKSRNSNSSNSTTNDSEGSPSMAPLKTCFDARLFPKLSKVIKNMESHGNCDTSPSDYSTSNYVHLGRDCGVDSIDDVNAATAMLALKHGPKIFNGQFKNSSPVITSSPSEDHTYSAGGGVGNSVNTVTTNLRDNGLCITNIENTNEVAVSRPNGHDNQIVCTSSDGAYESNEENPKDLEDQKRHMDGVDALLSLSSLVDIALNKRPPSTTLEEEHISTHMENIPHSRSKSILSNTSGQGILDEGYNTQSYYSHVASPSPPKKQKPLRNIRAKIKRKTTWIRFNEKIKKYYLIK